MGPAAGPRGTGRARGAVSVVVSALAFGPARRPGWAAARPEVCVCVREREVCGGGEREGRSRVWRVCVRRVAPPAARPRGREGATGTKRQLGGALWVVDRKSVV